MKPHMTRRTVIRPGNNSQPRKVSAELMVPEPTETTAIAIRTFFGASPAHLALPEDLTFEQFIAFAPQLSRIDATVQWWIGDYLNYAERRFKPQLREVIDQLNLNNGKPYGEKAIEASQRVAKAIPPAERDLRLTWNHYVKIAKFKRKDERAYWVGRVLKESLSTRALSAAIYEDSKERKAHTASSPVARLHRMSDERVILRVDATLKDFHEVYTGARMQWEDKHLFNRATLGPPTEGLRDALNDLLMAMEAPRKKAASARKWSEVAAAV